MVEPALSVQVGGPWDRGRPARWHRAGGLEDPAEECSGCISRCIHERLRRRPLGVSSGCAVEVGSLGPRRLV